MNLIKSNKHFLGLVIYTSWCGLGYIRGINNHKYNHSKYHSANEPYLYSSLVIDGIFGMMVYANPLCLPFTLHKELYRLEINVRKLEKNKKYYELLL